MTHEDFDGGPPGGPRWPTWAVLALVLAYAVAVAVIAWRMP